MPPRFYCSLPLHPGLELDLPESATRHAQVLRLQPGHAITLFGSGMGQWQAHIIAMGKGTVRAQIAQHEPTEREAPRTVHLAVGLVANERMDYLIEKATELGVASISPLLADRCVMRLSGERAQKRVAHWQAVAIAACEQSGRNTVPAIAPVQSLAQYLQSSSGFTGQKGLLSLNPKGQSLRAWSAPVSGSTDDSPSSVHLLSGTEGGWTPIEEKLAHQHGFTDILLVSRTLRADTAPLAALAALVL